MISRPEQKTARFLFRKKVQDIKNKYDLRNDLPNEDNICGWNWNSVN